MAIKIRVSVLFEYARATKMKLCMNQAHKSNSVDLFSILVKIKGFDFDLV